MAHKQLVPEKVPSWLRQNKPAFGPRPYTSPEGDLRQNKPAFGPRPYTSPEGDLRQKLLKMAKDSGHPDPEKMADTAIRAREKSMALLAARPKLLMTKEIPKPTETVTAAEKKGRTVPNAACRCKAQTLEGKQCGFKATCGDFCKKHSPN